MISFDKSTENTLKEDGDHIYYNVNIKNTPKNKGLAVFDDNRVEPIITNPNLYDIAVVRFSVPSQNIPIFIWRGDEDPLFISLEYKDITYSTQLEWFDNSPSDRLEWYGKAVWNYNDFVNSINIAFKNCYDNLKITEPTAPFTFSPKMTFNPHTELCSIYVEPSYSSEITTTSGIKIYFNEGLSNFFPAFQNYGNDDFSVSSIIKKDQILFIPNITNLPTINGISYIVAEEEYSTLFLWNDFKTLLFETDCPVITESQGAQKNDIRRVLTDFEPLEQINDRSSIQYFPQGLPRFYDLVSSYPLSRISIRVFWETKGGKIFPIRLNKSDILTVKLYFKRKGYMIDY